MQPLSAHQRNTLFQLRVASQQFVAQSPRYLFSGVVLGVMGFGVAIIPYLMRIGEKALEGAPLRRRDVPATVSELVSKWDTVEARVFFGFELTAAILLILSEYPFKLRNAGCVPSAGGCSVCVPLIGTPLIAWATFRQFVPPLGLILVALCPTVPVLSEATAADSILISVHCGAAVMLFVGFLLGEAHILSVQMPGTDYAPLRCPCSPLKVHEHHTPSERALLERQYRWRFQTWRVSLWCFVLFQLVTVFLMFYSGAKKRYNVISFVLEVTAGLSMLANHWAIWYFCRERNWEGALEEAFRGVREEDLLEPPSLSMLARGAGSGAREVELAGA